MLFVSRSILIRSQSFPALFPENSSSKSLGRCSIHPRRSWVIFGKRLGLLSKSNVSTLERTCEEQDGDRKREKRRAYELRMRCQCSTRE